MAHYNMLSEVSHDDSIASWRFRVKIHRVYSWYSYVTGTGPLWTFILADEAGTKMEMTMYSESSNTLKGLETQEGKWIEIFRVKVEKAFPGFKATRSPFTLSCTPYTQVRIIDPLNDRHYMEFKSLHEIPFISRRDTDYPIDTMGVVFDTEAHLDDPVQARMVFYIRDNIENQIKCVATGSHAKEFRDGFEKMRGRGEVIVVLKMWRVIRKYWPDELWLETKGGLSDFRFNPRLPEVEEFRQSLLNSDPYVRRHGVMGPL